MEKNSIKSNVKNKIKNSKLGLGLFIVLIVLIAIIKQVLVADLPINILAHAKQDDALMIDMAKEMLNGNYLGGYNDLIFTKGIMFPLFLVIGYSLGFSYISFQTLVYTLSCAFFIYSIKDFIKSKWILLGIFVALVFNPLSFASETLMRVYRNGITMSQVLIIIGSYIGMYMNRTDKKKTLFFALFGGLGIGTMYHTREDAFWIMPFMIVVTMILIGLLIKDKKKDIIKTGKMQTFIYVIPFVILTLVTNIISTINYNHYGIYIGNESHSTLTVNGKHHMVKSFVPLTDVWKEKKRKGARLDMTSVFAGQVADAERGIWLDRKNHLHVEDRISASGRDIEVRWTMMTPAEAEIISEKEIRLEKNGHRMVLRFESSGFEALPFVLPDDPPHEYDAPNPGTCRVGFTVTVPAGAEAVLKASLVPVR